MVKTLARLLFGSIVAIVVGLWAPKGYVRPCAAQSGVPESIPVPEELGVEVPDELDVPGNELQIPEEIERPSGQNSAAKLKPLGMIRLDAKPHGPTPKDESAEFFHGKTVDLNSMGEVRDWPMTAFGWRSAGFCPPPLYFNHDSLEIHGHSSAPHIQPILSGLRFYSSIPLVPAKMAHSHLAPLGGAKCSATRRCRH